MCGATGAQMQLQQEQMAFYQQGMQESATAFSEDQALLKQMESVYEPILAKGPNQEGFSKGELDTLDAQAVEGTAGNYKNAAKAVNEEIAAEGGGNNPLPTGAQEQLKEEVAAASANQESSEESQILQADYAQGYSEFQNAGEALSVASGQLNPTAYENSATSAGSAASTTANDIAQENNSWVNAALGAAGSIGSAVVSENPSNIFG